MFFSPWCTSDWRFLWRIKTIEMYGKCVIVAIYSQIQYVLVTNVSLKKKSNYHCLLIQIYLNLKLKVAKLVLCAHCVLGWVSVYFHTLTDSSYFLYRTHGRHEVFL